MNLYGHSTLSSQRTLEVLSESPMFRDYALAFTQGTGLPLRLQGPGLLHVVRYARKQENPFSALMAATDRNCTPSSAQCYALHCRLEDEAQFEPKTLQSFAGMCVAIASFGNSQNQNLPPRKISNLPCVQNLIAENALRASHHQRHAEQVRQATAARAE